MRWILFASILLSSLVVAGCFNDEVSAPGLDPATPEGATRPADSGVLLTREDLLSRPAKGIQGGADVAVTEFDADTLVVRPGDSLTLSATLANLGGQPAGGPFDAWIGVLDTDFEFGRLTVDSLAVGETRSGTVHYSVPVAKFAKAYPPGTYTLYCTHDFGDINPTNDFLLLNVQLLPDEPVGTIVIDVTPDEIMAGWTLTGPDGSSRTGNGDTTLWPMPAGEYTVEWFPVMGYPTPPPMQGVLTEGQIMTFNGRYSQGSSSFGMYFDQDATESCSPAGFLDHVTAYIIYRDPELIQIRGFECGFDITLPAQPGASIISAVTTTFPVPATDVGINDPGRGVYNLIVGFNYALGTVPATVVATLDILVLDQGEIDITLRAADPQSPPLDDLPKVVRNDYGLTSVSMAYAPGVPALVITGGDPCAAAVADFPVEQQDN